MKSLLLLSALLINPVALDEVIEEVPTEEVSENVDVSEVTEEQQNEEVVEEEQPKQEVEITKEELTQLIESNTWLQDLVKNLGIVYGAVGGGSLATLLVVVARAIFTAIKSKKITKETLSSVKEAVLKEVETTVGKEVADKINEPIAKLTETINALEVMQSAMSKIVALSQEDSYESRLAILECIASLNVVDSKTIEVAKESVLEEKEQEEKQIEQAHENLDTIIEETQAPDIKI